MVIPNGFFIFAPNGYSMIAHQKIQQSKRRNKTLRDKAIMEEFNKHDCQLIPISVIWRKFIYPKFFISRGTLYQILNNSLD